MRGDVKIFDFGLAKELSERHRVEGTNVYKMTKDAQHMCKNLLKLSENVSKKRQMIKQ